MANAYGGIVICMSKDSKIDGVSLVEAMNRFSWSNDNVEWRYSTEGSGSSGEIYLETMDGFSKWGITDPTVFLDEEKFYLIEDDEGNNRMIPKVDATEHDVENAHGIECEELSLASISDQFSPHIKAGWFQVSCASHTKMAQVEMSTLRVFADGCVERKRFLYSGCGFKDLIETYDPTSSTTKIPRESDSKLD